MTPLLGETTLLGGKSISKRLPPPENNPCTPSMISLEESLEAFSI
jgi:hypothetical protein